MEVRVIGSEELRKLAKDLNKAGQGEVRKQMVRGMREIIKPIVPDVRAAIRATPGGADRRSRKAKEERPRHLRDATARGVQAKVSVAGPKVGARIRIDPRHFPAGQRGLPAFLDGTLPRWRHPTFDHLPWVNQQSHPYFERTIHPHLPRATREMERVIDEVKAILARGHG